jgi:transposase
MALGLSTAWKTTVILGLVGHLPFSYQQTSMYLRNTMLNSGMKQHSIIKVHSGFFSVNNLIVKERCIMKKYFHGIDLHKRYVTVNVRNETGVEIQHISHCTDFQEYIDTLTSKDSVVIESINNAFYWADQIEEAGASCVIVNPHRFKIIKDSWNKTDKRDAANLSLALWMSELRNEFKLPIVYKPCKEIRQLRKLFSFYMRITEEITMHKNSIQAIFVENGIALSRSQSYQLCKQNGDASIAEELPIDGVSRFCILKSVSILQHLAEQKEDVKEKILEMSIYFEHEIKLCISIHGVSVFMALAFLADAGDIRRFKNVNGFDAYMGLVPTVKSSGGKTYMGHICRESRKLARTLFTQPILYLIDSSPKVRNFYNEVKERRGVGRSRIAVIRKIFNIMRRMILNGELYYGYDEIKYEKKLKAFEKILKKVA